MKKDALSHNNLFLKTYFDTTVISTQLPILVSK